jgi:phage shock protein PspC (stress-responsive transcriptional regulator)
MDDMNEQTGPPTADPTNQQSSGPRVSGDQMRDVDRLRRSTTDRYIAGVAGGLGRHFDIDPTVIRVTLAVLTFFGGAGVLVYGVVWLFVPEDGQDRAPIEVSTDVRRIILIVSGVIALSIVFGTPFLGNGWGNGFPVPLLVIGLVAAALYATRSQRSQSRLAKQPPPPWGTVPAAAQTTGQTGGQTTPSPHAPEGMTMPITDTAPDARSDSYTDTRTAPGQPPAWMPPPAPAYVPPPRPRRTGLVLFWPTLALIAIALGTLGIYDTTHHVTISAYGALAVAITAVMLLVGAFVGRPGGLIALGFASSIALVVTSIVGVATDENGLDNKDVRAVPTTAAAVADDYHVSTGTIELDLTRVRDLRALDGRTVDLGTDAGEITVIVPDGLNVHVTSEVRYAGQINLGDEQRDGLGQSMERTLTTSAAPNAPTLDLDIEVRFGQITVSTQN